MKPLALILLILPLTLQAQYLSVVYQPSDNGIGLQYMQGRIYGSVTWGNYNIQTPEISIYIPNHWEISAGYRTRKDYRNCFGLLGMSYHYYHTNEIQEGFKDTIFGPVSFEAGAGCFIGRSIFMLRIDLFRIEGEISIGIKFNKK